MRLQLKQEKKLNINTKDTWIRCYSISLTKQRNNFWTANNLTGNQFLRKSNYRRILLWQRRYYKFPNKTNKISYWLMFMILLQIHYRQSKRKEKTENNIWHYCRQWKMYKLQIFQVSYKAILLMNNKTHKLL
jgi:hypothetical protein